MERDEDAEALVILISEKYSIVNLLVDLFSPPFCDIYTSTFPAEDCNGALHDIEYLFIYTATYSDIREPFL